MKPLALSCFVSSLCLAGLVSAADLTAPNAAFNWTNANAWNSGTATWNSGDPLADPVVPPDNALFGAISADRTATLTSAITAGNISFSNAANTWTVSGTGGQITLNGVLSKTGAGTTVISANTLLTGAGSVLINGGELQLLNNNHDFTGGVTLNAGTLRVGTGIASPTDPASVSSVGTGTLTLNGGSIYHTQGNVRAYNINAVIGGNITAYFTGTAGGMILGNAGGTRTVSLGTGMRTITVGNASDGTGANAIFALQSLTNGAGGGIIKEGAGVMRINGTSFNGTVIANEGTVEVNAAAGAASYVINSGAFWRKTTNDALTPGGSMTLNGGNMILNTTAEPGNSRSATFATLQVSGTSNVFVGAGLSIQTSGGTTSGTIFVRDGGVMGGNGLLRTASTQTYAAGVSGLSDFTNSAITLSAGGQFRPGTPDALNSTIGALSFGTLTWNGESSATAQMAFNLGAGNTSDTINLSAALIKGSGSNFIFDFLGFNATEAALFTLFEFDSQSGFDVDDFSATNITFGEDLSGGFVLNSNSLQYQVSVIPEPAAALLGAMGLLALLRRRR